jgi:hypothetical protein
MATPASVSGGPFGQRRKGHGLVAGDDQGQSLDHDLRRQRRQDHDEHRGLALP